MGNACKQIRCGMKKISSVTACRQAVIDKDSELIKNQAHTIKGGAANLTAKKLSEIAFGLENIGKSGELKGADNLIHKFEKEFSRLEVYLNDRQI